MILTQQGWQNEPMMNMMQEAKYGKGIHHDHGNNIGKRNMQNNYDNATHNKHTTTTKIKEGIWSIGLGELQHSTTTRGSRPEI